MAGIANKRRGLSEAEVLALISSAGLALSTSAPSNPAASAAVGTGTVAAREDHVHQWPPASVYSTGGDQALTPAAIGAQPPLSSTYQQLGSAPGFSSPVTAPTSGVERGRDVWGHLEVGSSATNAGKIDVQVETGVGTGSYQVVQRLQIPAGGFTFEFPYAFHVPAGRRYQFVGGGLAGTTEVIATYNYRDL